ncbi:hypothetical protein CHINAEXTREME_05655 [Halobiforma lacisalsi AJ5]|uniref:Uncharacterized protein n=1 Tax=Natronobacterium lacisalsi AJ5 TaxID=358396 RepID=M0LP37_NATLA|nr:hypothetical protein [Halobiforma lacisalsi]APW97288.1 hypothetical protein CHINAEXTREME_05655 [Halobiforma lacisalsi AJ5]EMA33800.1 hypothetical protein C445_08929 [Halobiforma lacisalsi AJ5]
MDEDATASANADANANSEAGSPADAIDPVDPVDPDDPGTVQWRRDASTSWTVRLLWSLGVGTFFAAISNVVFWRLYDFTEQAGGATVEIVQTIFLATIAAVAVTVLALAVSGNSVQRLERLLEALPVPSGSPSRRGLSQALDAAVGTVVMAGLIGGLVVVGRSVAASGNGVGGVLGPAAFTGLAAISIPLALVALVLASFLRSVGAVDRTERTIYLYDPDRAIDLEVIRDVSVRRIGDIAVLSLDYAQPGGQYVAGPRRIVVPPSVAEEITGLVDSSP